MGDTHTDSDSERECMVFIDPTTFPRGQSRPITSDITSHSFFRVLVLCTAVLHFSGLSGPVGPGAESVNAAALQDW